MFLTGLSWFLFMSFLLSASPGREPSELQQLQEAFA